VISSVLSRRIKQIQKVIVAETTALAGSTTESLRNIELVKSLGLGQQEIARLNATTRKILTLELKKVKYLRSLSFIQGTCVNFLRTSIMFLMLYLIYSQAITVGQFLSLFIYSFFIFGPLQELGNIINIYRETEASLNVFQEILRTPARAQAGAPAAAGGSPGARIRARHVPTPVCDLAGGHRYRLRRRARRDDRLRRTIRSGEDHAGQAAGGPVSAAVRAESSTTACPAPTSISISCASGSAS
jgi:ABC-type multidrug transport system fused ATPase/permease subunit